MEQRKKNRETRRKQTIRRAVIAGTAGLLLALCVTASCIPGAWKKIYGAAGLTDLMDKAAESPFSMTVLDVGKADAIVIFCEGSAMMVDCGRTGDDEKAALCLEKMGVRRLTCALNTHPDSDHIGGFPELLRRVDTNSYLEPVMEPSLLEENPDREDVLSVLRSKKILIKTLSAGDEFALNGAAVRVLSPRGGETSENDCSVVLKITYGETSFLLTGDAEEEAEQTMLRSGEDLHADVLKVGHHGSETSTGEDFLTAVSPSMAAISVGEDRNHLPKDPVLRRLSDHHVTTYRTDLSGTLLFTSDGHTVQVLTEQGGNEAKEATKHENSDHRPF